MDKPFLVDRDVEEGRQLLRALDEAGIPIDAAYWLYRLEKGRWRMTVATPHNDVRTQPDIYQRVQDVLRTGVAGQMTLDDVSIVSPRDPIASGLYRIPGSQQLGEFRPTGAVVNGLSVDDAYVYRSRPLPTKAKA